MTCDCKHPYGFMSADEGPEGYSHVTEVEFSTVWKRFKEHTTAHGIPHVYHARGPIKNTLWIVLSLVSLGLLAYTIAGLIIRFIEWPVTVVVTVEHEKEIDFPAVTLCNMNPVQKSALVNNSDLQDLFTVSDRKRRAAPDFTDETTFALNLRKYLAEQDLETKTALGHQREHFILGVKYEGIQIPIDAFHTWFDPTYGNCFTFNSGRENTDIRTSHLSGPLYGLDVVFNIEQDEYIGAISHSAGVRVVIHNHTTMPFPSEQGFTISPGEVTYIGMVELEIYRLGGRYGNCTEVTSEQNFTLSVYEEYYPVLYTQDACVHTCFQRNIIELCGCATADIPTEGEAFGDATVPICDITDETSYQCYSDVKDKYIHSELDCECETACHEVEFQVTTSSGLWPSDEYQEDLLIDIVTDHPDLQDLLYDPDDSAKYQRNLGRVSLYFSHFNKEVITEKSAYPSTTFVSDIGGVLGLFVGFSILTIAEFFEIAMDFLVLASCKCCSRRKVREKQNFNRSSVQPMVNNNTTIVVGGREKPAF